MAKSRKDSRGYVLRTGESQRKDGRYSYSYTDLDKIDELFTQKHWLTQSKRKKNHPRQRRWTESAAG